MSGGRTNANGLRAMSKGHVNLVKLCVGIGSVEELQAWRDIRRSESAAGGKTYRSCHVTRMWPRRQEEVLSGGSLYWVIRGVIQVRQTIAGLEECIGADGIRRCRIVMDPELVRTAASPRRPFQGWRYLEPANSPPDLPGSGNAGDLPHDLERALSDLGIL